MQDELIWGKDNTKGITSIEIDDDIATIYLADNTTKIVSNRFWIVSPHRLEKNWIRLEGDLHYKWGKQYSDRGSFYTAKKKFKVQDIYTINDPKESFMVNKGYTYYKGMKPTDVSILSFDIETNGLNQDDDSRIFLISNTFRHKDKVIRRLFCYDKYNSDGEMLDDWCQWVKELDPSVMCGHNIFGYDLPYMAHVAELNNTVLMLGKNNTPISFAKYESKFRKDQTQDLAYHNAYIHGREIIDTMFLSIKYDIATKKYDSYGLKSIIKTEGLEVEGRQYYDAAKIRYNYNIPEEWEKIKKYAEHDADDSLALFDLMAPSYFYMTQSIPKSFQSVVQSASGSQLNSIMVRSYLQTGHSLPRASEAKEYEGAISFGTPGVHSNVLKADVSSLYPSIMLQYEVCDTEKDPRKNFLKILLYFTTERLKNKKLSKETKDKYYEDMQQSQKIFINSLYGFLGTVGLLFNSPAKASFITEKGREILNKSIDWANKNDLVVVNGDTDSISIKHKEELAINETEQNNLLESLNKEFPEKIRFENDGYFPKMIVLKAKNYILWDGKKIKTKGSSIRDPKREPAIQEFITKIIDILVYDKGNAIEIYNEYVKEILNVKDIQRWSMKKTITSKVMAAERTNELNIKNAIAGTEYVEGDKPRFYYKPDGKLALIEKFDGAYFIDKYMEKLYNAVYVFETVIDVSLFLNYKLKRNKQTLEDLR